MSSRFLFDRQCKCCLLESAMWRYLSVLRPILCHRSMWAPISIARLDEPICELTPSDGRPYDIGLTVVFVVPCSSVWFREAGFWLSSKGMSQCLVLMPDANFSIFSNYGILGTCRKTEPHWKVASAPADLVVSKGRATERRDVRSVPQLVEMCSSWCCAWLLLAFAITSSIAAHLRDMNRISLLNSLIAEFCLAGRLNRTRKCFLLRQF